MTSPPDPDQEADPLATSRPSTARRRLKRPRSDAWLKDIDLSRVVENTLVGVVLFFGRYPMTFVQVLFRPAPMEKDLIFNPSYRNHTQVRFTRPMTFLVVSGFVYLAFALNSVGYFIPVEGMIEHFQGLIGRMPTKVESLTLSKIALFMVPFVLFVALYAYIAHLVFRALRAPLHFKIHLNVACYVAGIVAIALDVLFFLEGPAWDMLLDHGQSWVRSVPLAALAAALFVLLFSALFRYLDLLRRGAGIGWVKTVIATALSVGVFELVSTAVLFVASPLLEKLR